MAPLQDRRHRQDRRSVDQGPPAEWRDRRNHPERRQIGVSETSYEEWLACSQQHSAPEAPIDSWDDIKHL